MATPLPTDKSQLDPSVLSMMTLIKQMEGNDYSNRSGDNGSSAGAYQWNNDNVPLKPGETPSHWKAGAQQYLGDANAPMTPANQNKVAYGEIAAYKAQGYSPDEVDALWNGAHKDPTTGKMVHNNPQRAVRFQAAAQDLIKKKQLATAAQGNPFAYSSPLTNIAQGNEDANVDVAKGAAKGALQVVRDASGVDTSPVVKGMLSNAPAFAQDVNAEKGMLSTTNPAQAQGAMESNVASGLLPVGEATKVAKTGLDLTKGFFDTSLTGPKDSVLTAVSPRLTKAVASVTPTQTQGLLSKITPVASQYLNKVADAVRPVFKDGAPWSTNAQAADGSIGTEAQSLFSKIGPKANYIFGELKSALNKTEIPHFIKTSDSLVQKRAQSIIDKFMEIAESNGGKVQSLLKSRQEFDAWVQKEYPRVFDDAGNAVSELVKNIRNTANKFIADNAPEEANVLPSLEKQSLLYDARDTFREKAALGELQNQGEIGTTNIQRWKAAHPGLTKIPKIATRSAIGLGTLGGLLGGVGAVKGFLEKEF